MQEIFTSFTLYLLFLNKRKKTISFAKTKFFSAFQLCKIGINRISKHHEHRWYKAVYNMAELNFNHLSTQ